MKKIILSVNSNILGACIITYAPTHNGVFELEIVGKDVRIEKGPEFLPDGRIRYVFAAGRGSGLRTKGYLLVPNGNYFNLKPDPDNLLIGPWNRKGRENSRRPGRKGGTCGYQPQRSVR